jgi:hypothetical protein
MTLDNTRITQYKYWGAEEMGNKLKALVLAWAVLLPAMFMVVLASSPVQGAATPTITAGWYSGTIDGSTNVASFNSIAVDSMGYVHVSYQDMTNLDLKYSTNSGGQWTATTIDGLGATGFYSSIAVDSKGFVHISYYDSTNEDLKYASNSGGSWINRTIDGAGAHVGEYSAIGVDSNGKAHIAYYDNTNQAIKYATNAGGSWVNMTVDATTNDGYSSIHLAVDKNNKVHIDYFDVEGSKIKYANNVAGNWINETVVAGDTTKFTSIAIDSSSRPYIAYRDGVSGYLKVATNDGSGWSFLTIDTSTLITWYVSLAIDSNDKLHIAYYDDNSNDLRYASNASGSWLYDVVDYFSDVGFFNSIAVDSNDKAFIAYIDATHNRLKVATNAGARWTAQDVDNGPGTGFWNNIAVDANGVIHIVYYNQTSSHLMHAYKASERAGWQIEVIDNTMNAGLPSSMVVDQHNKVHVAYYNSNAQSLKYANNVNGYWVNSTVDGTNNVGLWNAIAVDSNDKVHIAYVDSTTHKLKYANNTVGGFATSYVDVPGDAKNAGVSIALDRMGVPHIAYITTSSDLMFGTKTGALTWNTTVVDGVTEILGYWNSMAIDSHDHIHITYYDQTGLGSLKYATNTTGNWVFSAIDRDGNVGQRSVLRLDANDGLHVFYYDDTAEKGNYAVNIDGIWMKTTIEDPDSAWYGSLALDSYGRAHICYFDSTTNSLKYAVTINLPSAPTTFAAQRGNAQVNLTWLLPTNNGGATVTGYKIYKGDTISNMTLLTTVIAGTYALHDTDVTNGVTYWYSVAAVNSEGIGQKATPISVVPATLPGVPLLVQAKGVNNAVELSWNAPANGGSAIVQYRILRGTDAANLTFLVNVSAPATSYRDTSLENGVTYIYAVSAVNDVGVGPLASTVSATPVADDMTLIIIGTIAAVAIIGVAVVLMMRKKK